MLRFVAVPFCPCLTSKFLDKGAKMIKQFFANFNLGITKMLNLMLITNPMIKLKKTLAQKFY
jgi:hypothetical protein